MNYTREEIYREVRNIVAKNLEIDENRISEDSVLTREFRADDLDWVSIEIDLEERFGVSVELCPDIPEAVASNNNNYERIGRLYVDSGKFNQNGIQALKKIYPYHDFTDFERNPEVAEFMHDDIRSVRSVVNYLESMLNEKGRDEQ